MLLLTILECRLDAVMDFKFNDLCLYTWTLTGTVIDAID
jgi:hypothetical protein